MFNLIEIILLYLTCLWCVIVGILIFFYLRGLFSFFVKRHRGFSQDELEREIDRIILENMERNPKWKSYDYGKGKKSDLY